MTKQTHIQFRCSEESKAELQQAAAEAGVSLSEFCLAAAMAVVIQRKGTPTVTNDPAFRVEDVVVNKTTGERMKVTSVPVHSTPYTHPQRKFTPDFKK